ncbi:hypothetical protein QF034_000018 [Streptomyces africanus]|uniref:Uncharacterized protein n=1 Tax=Streptomyces africanus TaxID=231024 RepID=A0ABU0QEH7_9ACTN|nr:hypothetical protein [Streptomyces africanus]
MPRAEITERSDWRPLSGAAEDRRPGTFDRTTNTVC